MPSFSFLKPLCAAMFLVTTCSCRDTEKEEQALKEVSQTLNQSAEELDNVTAKNLKELNAKLVDPNTKVKAEKWAPMADFINRLSKQTTKQIDSLQQLLSKKNYTDLSEHASNIYLSYISKVLKIDNEIDQVFRRDTDTSNFHNYNSLPLANIFLSTLKHNISRLNAHTVTFCNIKVINSKFTFDVSEALIGQSSTILSPGETLEITAGIGEFSSSAQPKIKINNRNISTEQPFAVSKIKVPKEPGMYKIPVEITYIDQSGTLTTSTYTITYKVVKVLE